MKYIKIEKKVILFFLINIILIIGLNSCNKKSYHSNSNEDWREEASIEIEKEKIVSKLTKVSIEEDTILNESIVSASLNSTVILPNNSQKISGLKRTIAISKDVKEKASKKINPLKKLAAVKIVKKLKSRINKNIKIGLILLLVGIVISAVGVWELGWLGGIVAVVGVVFLILGLIEMM